MESMDYIEPDISENYKYLQEHNTSTREHLVQQPHSFNQCKNNNNNKEHNEEKYYNQSSYLYYRWNHLALLRKRFHYDHHQV